MSMHRGLRESEGSTAAPVPAVPAVPAAPAVSAADEGGSTPRYLQLARALQDCIQSGQFAVGSLVPTEIDLSKQHGVSRQTVRQAIGLLRERGLLSARRGIGTRVEARHVPQRLSYPMLTATDLVDLAAGSEMIVDERKWIEARGPLAAKLGCRANHRWLRLDCTRRLDGERPFASVRVHIDGRVAAAMTIPDRLRTALFVMIEEQRGEQLLEIEQEIRATVLDADMATRIMAPEGTPALEITRRYFGSGRRLMLVSVNTLPSDRFFYSVTIQRN